MTPSECLAWLAERSVERLCPVPGLDMPCWVRKDLDPDRYSNGPTPYTLKPNTMPVHRLAFALLRDDIFLSEGLVIDHRCFTKGCWNPWHADPVTLAVNSSRQPPWRRSTAIDRTNLKPSPPRPRGIDRTHLKPSPPVPKGGFRRTPRDIRISDLPCVPDPLLTIQQAAERAGVVSVTIYKWRKMGFLTTYRTDLNRVRIDPAEVDRVTTAVEDPGAELDRAIAGIGKGAA